MNFCTLPLRWLIALLPFFCLTGVFSAEAHEAQHVLVLNSNHRGYPWSDSIMEGISAVLERPIGISYEYMDTQQHRPEDLYPLLEQLYRQKFSDHHDQFDVAIVTDNNALEFILPRRELLLPGVPIVFCGINDYDEGMLAGQRAITGVAEDFDLAATIRTALALHPETRNLAVISDVTTTGRINHQRFLAVKPEFAERLEIIELVGLTFEELQKKLQALPPRTVVLNLSFYRDPTGRVFSADQSTAMIVAHSRAPVYSAWGFIVRRGALGGIVVSGRLQGEHAARMALRILRGERADAIPVETESPNVPMFNHVQMQRFGVRRADLPAGSIIVNEPETLYYRYKHLIWAAILLTALQFFIILGLVINFLRRQKAETELRRSETRFRSYFEMGLIGAAVGTPEKKWVAVNDRLCQILGYSREELLDKPWPELTHPDDVAPNQERFARVAAGEIDGFTMEKRFVRKDGGIINAEISMRGVRKPDGALEYTIAHVQDITARKQAEMELAGYREHLEELIQKRTTALAAANEQLQLEMLERKQAEQSLRESEEKYRSLVERANDGIMIVQGDALTFANPELAALLGYTREELTGSTLEKILTPEIYRLLLERHRRRVAGEKMPARYETTLVHRTGALIDVEFNVGLVSFEGRPASLVFVRDIRERKQLEEERAKLGKLESIGVLAGGIAHDFNNLLTGIMGNISLAKFLVDAESKAVTLLANAENISLRARELTDRLITFSEGGAPIKKIVQVSEFLPQAVEFALSGTAVRSRLDLADDLRVLEGDPGQLRQLISILVLNAREAMPDGGEVEVTASNEDLQENRNGGKAGPFVKIVVADQGKGIAPEHLPKIFDPYFSTKEMGNRKGTGLGLSIAYSIVRRHEGRIDVSSTLNKGTRVTVYLPAVVSQDFAAMARLAQGHPGEGRRILLLDDDQAVLEVASDILQFLGYEVETATTGEEVLARYRQAQDDGRPFDAVILDLTIRDGMGGATAMQELLKIDPGVRALVSSGLRKDPFMLDYRYYGFKAAIFKPYHLQELHMALEKVLGEPDREKSEHNGLPPS